jgi:hypothetical protein
MSTSETNISPNTEPFPSKEMQAPDINLSTWIFERIRPFVGGRILEIDNGDGYIAPFCRQRGIQTDVMRVNLSDTDFDEEYRMLLGSYSMVLALHIPKDAASYRQVIANCASLLKTQGFLVIQLPACTALYRGLDDGYRKWKWYNTEFIHKLLHTNFSIIKIRYRMVTDTEPLISEQSIKYRERVNVFTSSMATGFQEGLHAIVLGQKFNVRMPKYNM